jgi:tetratricopeptide (TPR) repeat protein
MTDISSTHFDLVRGHHFNHSEGRSASAEDVSVASSLPTRVGSLRLVSAFCSTVRIRRTLHRGQAALNRADVHAAEAAGRWALSRLPDPTVIQPTSLSASDRTVLVAALELVAQARRESVDLAAAVHLHHQALSLLSAAPRTAGRDRDESMVLNRLAETLRLLGRHVDAEVRQHEALALAENLQPADVVLVASALNGLGSVFRDTRRYANAACTYHRALRLAEGDLSRDDPLIAGLFHNLARLDHAQQRYTVGEPKARRALQLRVLRDGPNSTGTADDLAVLGALLRGQGRHAEAEAILRQSLAIWQHHFGAHHYQVADVQQELAELYSARGEAPRARQTYQQVLDIKRHVLGPEHQEVAALQRRIDATLNAPGSP